MKILLDHQIFSSQTVGGISRYHIEYLKKIRAEYEIPVFFSNNLYLKELKQVKGFFPGTRFRGKERLLELINRQKTISALREGDFDVFHPTFYSSSTLPHLKNRPMVLTVHDMIHDRWNQLPAAKWEMREKFIMAKAASAIIVPSRFTADELMELYDIPAAKIHVVYHGVPEWKADINTRKIPGRFLFVGGRKYYKNFDIVLKALQLFPESTLALTGPKLSPEECAKIADAGLQNKIRYCFCRSDEELAALYASSEALIFPSKAEGFGLPLLEAFIAGTPVICSDIPVFREIGRDCAIYFDPDRPEALADAMRSIQSSRLAGDVQELLKNFSWEKCAAETLSVYESIL